jgi:hypothetical protein
LHRQDRDPDPEPDDRVPHVVRKPGTLILHIICMLCSTQVRESEPILLS